MKRGLLIVNLGTPDEATPTAVGKYLREFLMDPYVIDIPKPLRWFLINVLIVPRRKHTSAEAYQTIWTDRGSPLHFHLHDLASSVQKELSDWVVEPAMRYGRPSIAQALQKLRLQGVTNLTVLPLYPQYAESSSLSSIQKVSDDLSAMGWAPETKIIRSFHDHDEHIEAWSEVLREAMHGETDPHVLFSYHGLPERHLKTAERRENAEASRCLDGGKPTQKESRTRKYLCCEKPSATCYRAQAVETTKRIAGKLGLSPDQWSLSFQSRLGRTPWIRPYTDEIIPELAAKGKTNLIVITPSFVADCLETIEEIGDRARELFLENGGVRFKRVECLNSRPSWVKAVGSLVQDAASKQP